MDNGKTQQALVRSSVYGAAAVGTLVLAGLAIHQVASAGGETIFAPFFAMTPNERGDFIAGFAAPIIMMWTLVAVLQQHFSIRIQQQELEKTRDEVHLQRKEFSKQTEIFKKELQNLERSDARSYLANIERQLQKHATMIRGHVDPGYDRKKNLDHDEIDVSYAEQALDELTRAAVGAFADNPTRDLRRAIDRMNTYVQRFKRIEEKFEACGLEDEYRDFVIYTAYGSLLRKCRSKLRLFAEFDIEGQRWAFDERSRKWIVKRQSDQKPASSELVPAHE